MNSSGVNSSKSLLDTKISYSALPLGGSVANEKSAPLNGTLNNVSEAKVILENEDGQLLDRIEEKSDEKSYCDSETYQDLKDLLLFGGLNSGAAIIAAASDFIAVKFVSDFDQNLLPASALISALQNFVFYVPSGCLCATAILISDKFANSSEKPKIGTIIQASFGLSGLMCIPGAFLTVFSGSMLKLFGQSASSSDNAQEYFRASAAGLPFYYLMVCNTQIGMALHRPKVIFLTYLVQRSVFLGLGYLFMFGVGELPSFGIAGLGYANAVSTFVAFAGSSYYLVKILYNDHQYQIFNFDFSALGKVFKDILMIGAPISGKIGIALAYVQILTWIAGWLGNDSLNSTQITLLYTSLLTLPATDLGQASGVLIKNALALSNIAKSRRLANICSSLSMVLPASALILFAAIPRPLVGFFVDTSDSKNQQIVDTTSKLLLYSAGGIFDSLAFAYEGSLRGFEDTTFAMFSGFVNNFLLAVPFALLSCFENKDAGSEESGICGVFAAKTVCMALYALSLSLRWFYRVNTESTIGRGNNLQTSQAPKIVKPSCWQWIKSCFWSSPEVKKEQKIVENQNNFFDVEHSPQTYGSISLVSRV